MMGRYKDVFGGGIFPEIMSGDEDREVGIVPSDDRLENGSDRDNAIIGRDDIILYGVILYPTVPLHCEDLHVLA